MTITYRWTATDACGNTTVTTQSFNVSPDTEMPAFDAQPATITDINCNDALPVQETLTASDACVNVNVVPSVDPFTEDQCGGYAITYRWTATDDCGNVIEKRLRRLMSYQIRKVQYLMLRQLRLQILIAMMPYQFRKR